MKKKETFVKNQFTWPICKDILYLILQDKVSDLFVCELVWERLFYKRELPTNDWLPSALTPTYWSEKFVDAPQIIAERKAAVHLTRSIPKDHKQGLKNFLNFKGYKINELYPRKTRRATAVNWLIYWANKNRCFSNDNNVIPRLCLPPLNPAKGHIGDPEIT